MRPNGLKNIEDFIVNDLFVEWVLTPNEENITLWASYLADHPDKMEMVEAAKILVLQLNEVESIVSPKGDFNHNWKVIQQKTGNQTQKKIAKVKKLNWWKYTAAITALILITAIAAYQFLQANYSQSEQIVETPSMKWLELKNTTARAQTIHLADKSTITLEPFSSLKYPSQFVKKQREVFLKGEAFFQIARDTTQPFVVYANETITKVLGTSFSIKAFEGEKEVEVTVKTGKVAVYANVNSLPKKIIKKKEKFVIRTDENLIIPIPNKKLEVTPNQRVVFNKLRADMHKSVAKLPLPIKPVKQLPKFRFYNEPVSEVLKALAEAYNLEISFDRKKLSNCLITTTLENVPIFEKLNIICQAMNLTYQEQEAVIYIYGQCK